MKAETIKAQRRTSSGTSAARRLRRGGLIPAILYGHRMEPVMLSIPATEVERLLESGHHLVTLEMDGTREQAIVKEIQFDTWHREVLHIDFARVSLHEKVRVTVDIVTHGTPKAVLAGGVLEQPLRSLEVECMADSIPDEIRVEVGQLEAGDLIHVRDLELPPGVKALDDPDTIVCIVQEARAVEEAAAPEPAPEAEEPEVIRKPEKEEEAEEVS